MIELLSPAGSRASLEAAVQSGADAVYMGFGAFNARRNAKNFTDEEFADAVAYCHLRGVRVFPNGGGCGAGAGLGGADALAGGDA